MLFFLPFSPLLLIYAAAAVLPALLLLRYIDRKDVREKEPRGLLISLLGMGVLAALGASILESVLSYILDRFLPEGSFVYIIVFAFFVVAVSEEGMKLFFLRRRTWNHPAFDYRFDAIVYSVFVSLGFAAYENLLYVFEYGLSVVVPRALLAIPGHMSFAVYMGVFYGQAKTCSLRGDETGCRRNLRTGFWLAVLHHGFYDACAMIGTPVCTVIFLLFVIAMFLRVRNIIRREAETDGPV